MVALRYESSRHVEKATSSGLFYVWLSAQLLSYSATNAPICRAVAMGYCMWDRARYLAC